MYGKKYVKKVVAKKPRKTIKRTTTKSVPESVKMYVKKAIAKNIEMKIGLPNGVAAVPIEVGNGSLPVPSVSNLSTSLAIGQGVTQIDRIGNKITLKKWLVKGFFAANPAGTYISGSQIIVDLYIGQRKDLTPVTGTLLNTDFLQAGSAPVGVTGFFGDTLLLVNKDSYNIFYHKRYKLGLASGSNGTNTYPNNDYKLTGYFSVDLCKKGFKDHLITYEDALTAPQDARIGQVYLWSTAVNADGSSLAVAMGGETAFHYFYQNTPCFTDA